MRTYGLSHLPHPSLTLRRVYSAYEHSIVVATRAPLQPSTTLLASIEPKITLPIDITLETIFSVLLLCVGSVLGSPELKPIQWNVWAGRLEKSKDARIMKEVGVGGGNPYAGLDERPGFLDIRGKRKEFASWVKEGGDAAKDTGRAEKNI